tara:strand:+ start:417 stop:647 length:231 start_codon:yes stop_codon:yes gene_type:complete
MTKKEFDKAKRVNYSEHRRKLSSDYDKLFEMLRDQESSEDVQRLARATYFKCLETLESIQKENKCINKIIWHVANL